MRETVRPETAIPSICSSPWIRGARLSRLSKAIFKMSRHTSVGMQGLPLRHFVFDRRAQNRRNRSRCHRTTVSG
jgi:hypothetical protein